MEECFQLSGRGLALAPSVAPEFLGSHRSGWRAKLQLVRPDGTEEIADAAFQLEHFNPTGFRVVCYLVDAAKEQVPAGTQLWLLETA